MSKQEGNNSDNYEVLSQVSVALNAIPEVYKFFRDLYLDCNDEGMLDEVVDNNEDRNPSSAHEGLTHEVEMFTRLYIRDAMVNWSVK